MGSAKIKVGLLTLSDGRKYIHDDLLEVNWRYQNGVAAALEGTGEIEVVAGRDIIWTSELARNEASRLAQEGCQLTIFNYAIWAFPHLTAVASKFAPDHFSCSATSIPPSRAWWPCCQPQGQWISLLCLCPCLGAIEDPGVLRRVVSFVRAAGALANLKGQTYGLFGGRPLGMYTAVANLDQWNSIFGVDVEHIEQYDIARYAECVEASRVDSALAWLEKHVGEIKYDGKMLTPDILKKQIRSYHAFRTIIENASSTSWAPKRMAT